MRQHECDQPEPLSEMVNLQLLNCSNTLVESLEALGNARSLRILNIDRTGVSSLIALNDLSGIQRLSCEHTNIPEGAIVNFIQTHPGTIVIYKTDQLSLWWNSLPSAWKEVFREQVAVGDIPDREQLHELVFLETLTIEENTNITSLEPLREFVGLTELGFSNTPINSPGTLAGHDNPPRVDLRPQPHPRPGPPQQPDQPSVPGLPEHPGRRPAPVERLN